MLRTAVRVRHRSPAGLLFLLALTTAACGASPSVAPSDVITPSDALASVPPASGPVVRGSATPAGSAAPSATPRPSRAPTLTAFWAAVSRGLTTARHLEVRIAGPNPGILRFEPAGSATIVGGKVVFVCVHGIAYDGQLGFARVPGTWQCGAAALVSGFRRIGQPADSWSASSPRDSSITEAVTQGSGGTWTWTYSGSPPSGGRVTVRISLDPASGRILAGQRTDPTGTATYAFDYIRTFPALAVPAH